MSAQANKCLERYGMTNCSSIDIKCECDECDGSLEFDGINKHGDLAFMMCNNCGCTYVSPAAKQKP